MFGANIPGSIGRGNMSSPTAGDSRKERRKRAERNILEARKGLMTLTAHHPMGIDAAAIEARAALAADVFYKNPGGNGPKRKLYDETFSATPSEHDDDAAGQYYTDEVTGEKRKKKGGFFSALVDLTLGLGFNSPGSEDISLSPAGATAAAAARPHAPAAPAKIGSGVAATPGDEEVAMWREMNVSEPAKAKADAQTKAFVGMTLRERSDWLRGTLNEFGEQVTGKTQLLAMYLTAKSVPFVSQFLAVAASGTVDAIRLVESVADAAVKSISPKSELPMHLRHHELRGPDASTAGISGAAASAVTGGQFYVAPLATGTSEADDAYLSAASPGATGPEPLREPSSSILANGATAHSAPPAGRTKRSESGKHKSPRKTPSPRMSEPKHVKPQRGGMLGPLIDRLFDPKRVDSLLKLGFSGPSNQAKGLAVVGASAMALESAKRSSPTTAPATPDRMWTDAMTGADANPLTPELIARRNISMTLMAGGAAANLHLTSSAAAGSSFPVAQLNYAAVIDASHPSLQNVATVPTASIATLSASGSAPDSMDPGNGTVTAEATSNPSITALVEGNGPAGAGANAGVKDGMLYDANGMPFVSFADMHQAQHQFTDDFPVTGQLASSHGAPLAHHLGAPFPSPSEGPPGTIAEDPTGGCNTSALPADQTATEMDSFLSGHGADENHTHSAVLQPSASYEAFKSPPRGRQLSSASIGYVQFSSSGAAVLPLSSDPSGAFPATDDIVGSLYVETGFNASSTDIHALQSGSGTDEEALESPACDSQSQSMTSPQHTPSGMSWPGLGTSRASSAVSSEDVHLASDSPIITARLIPELDAVEETDETLNSSFNTQEPLSI
jgi:hypothetical protein